MSELLGSALVSVRSRLTSCLEEHIQCAAWTRAAPTTSVPDQPQGAGPPRLILLSCGSSPSHAGRLLRARLVDGADHATKKYAALSYVWGTDSARRRHYPVTTRATIASHQNAVSIDDLPPTIREALNLVWLLGIRYLWVDALCVIQDSPNDWDNHGGLTRAMIFRKAIVTIISPTNSVEKSFLTHMEHEHSLARRVGKVYHNNTTGETDGTVDSNHVSCSSTSTNKLFANVIGADQPVSSRAWCLHEIELSTRIIYFARTGQSVDTTAYIPQFVCRTELKHKPMGDMSIDAQQNSKTGYYDWWYTIVKEYTQRKMTRQEDRLLGLAALAAHFHSLTNYVYHAGIWQQDCFDGLLWTCDNPDISHRLYLDGCPTWSWASISGAIQYTFRGYVEKHEEFELQDVDTMVISAQKATPTPALLITGITGRAICTASQNRTGHMWQLRDPGSAAIIGDLLSDCLDELSDGTTCTYIVIGETTSVAAKVEPAYTIALLLEQITSTESAKIRYYSRRGLVKLFNQANASVRASLKLI